MDVYKSFHGDALAIAQKIKQRRLQLLVHSYIYYQLDDNIISDSKWSEWAVELMNLQNKYPEISNSVIDYLGAFKDWDASTGAFLPLNDEWVIQKSLYLLSLRDKQDRKESKQAESNKETKRALF